MDLHNDSVYPVFFHIADQKIFHRPTEKRRQGAREKKKKEVKIRAKTFAKSVLEIGTTPKSESKVPNHLSKIEHQ